MRKTTLRRLEALEKEHRSREQEELSSLEGALVYIRLIVLAYYLGGLKSDEEEEGPWEADEEKEAIIYVDHLNRPWEAYARALKYPSWRSEEHTSELQSQSNLVCRLLLEKKKNTNLSAPSQELIYQLTLPLASAVPAATTP